MTYNHNPEFIAWCLDKHLDPNCQTVFESYIFREDAECNPADFPGMTPEELKLYEAAE
jgi:hypothetical protein